MFLRHSSLVFLIITALSFSAFAQSPEDKEAPDIAKIRSEWFYAPRRDPQGHVRGDLRLKALQQKEQMRRKQQSGATATQAPAIAPSTLASPSIGVNDASTGTTPAAGSNATAIAPAPSSASSFSDLASTPWQPIGPQPMNNAGIKEAGRVIAIAVDPRNSSVAYLGTAEGGVWKTTDAGTNWTPLTDNQVSLATGSLVLDPSNPDTIYLGTGEGTGGTTARTQYYGAGILKSTNGGASWTNLPGPFAKRTFGSGGSRILSLGISPTNSQTLIAAVSSDYQTDDGIWRSTDGANTWTHVLTCEFPWTAFFVANGNAYATCELGGASHSQVLKSTDGGVTWNAVGAGLGTPFDYIELTAAPSNPAIMYAGLESPTGSNGTLMPFMYKSTDGGTTFTQLTNAPQYCNQCSYANVIRVSPTDPNVVFAGGLDLWRSLDGGASWSDQSASSNSNSLHADQHAVVFASDGSTLYAGNDGGVWSSTNYTATSSTLPPIAWNNLNSTLNTALLYPGLTIDPANPSRAFVGTQDNGNLRYTGALEWDILFCGDGGFTVTPGNGTDYATCFLGIFSKTHVYKSTSDGAVGTWTEMPQPTTEAMVNINSPFVGDPNNASRLYFGAQHVFQSNDGAQTWQIISPQFGSALGGVAVSPSNPNVVWAGVQLGGVVRVTQNALSGTAATWSTTGALLPQHRYLTSLAVDPHNPAVGYATYAGFSGFGDTGQVFLSSNYGASWSNITGNLPNIPVNAIVVDPDAAGTLYVATDVGVFYSTDNGASWAEAGTGLPNAVAHWLTLHEGSRILRVSTHGRGAWDLQLPTVTNQSCPAPATAGVKICTPANGATVQSPVHFTAAATGNAQIKSMKIYVDGVGGYTVNAASLDTSVTMANGSHKITIKAWDINNASYSNAITITVGSSTTCSAPSGGVAICSPAPNSTVSSPVHIVGKSNLSPAATSTVVYIDSVKKYSVASPSVDTTLAVAAGSHHLTVQSYNGTWVKASETFSVAGSTCTASTVNRTVTICSPANAATVSSPVHFVAKTTDSSLVSSMVIYIDSVKVYSVGSGSLDTSLNVAAGSHHLTIKAWDSTGSFSASETFAVQ